MYFNEYTLFLSIVSSNLYQMSINNLCKKSAFNLIGFFRIYCCPVSNNKYVSRKNLALKKLALFA